MVSPGPRTGLLVASCWPPEPVAWLAGCPSPGAPLDTKCLKTYSIWSVVVLLVPVQQLGCLNVLKASEPWMKAQRIHGGGGQKQEGFR